MNAELYGLVGVLGGAGIAGAVAYFGPLRLLRQTVAAQEHRDAEQRDWQAQEREWQAREERTKERTARIDAQHAFERERREHELERLVAVRTAPREWEGVLARAIRDLAHGPQVDMTDIDEAVSEARRQFSASMDALLKDGIYLRQSHRSPTRRDESDQALYEYEAKVMEALEITTFLLRQQIHAHPNGSGDLSHLTAALRVVERQRAELSHIIITKIEETIRDPSGWRRTRMPDLYEGAL